MREEAREFIDEIKQILREEKGGGGRMDKDKIKAELRDAAFKIRDCGRDIKEKYDAMDAVKKKKMWAAVAGAAMIAAGALAIAKSKKHKCHRGE